MQKAAIVLALLSLAASTGYAQRAPAPAPSSCTTIAQTAAAANLTTLLAAANAAGLTSTLSNPNAALTVFAPTNEAFSDALAALGLTQAQLLASPLLRPILENHILGTPIPAADLISYGTVRTMNNNAPLNITASTIGGQSVVDITSPSATATVLMADVRACRSIVHVISDVLTP